MSGLARAAPPPPPPPPPRAAVADALLAPVTAVCFARARGARYLAAAAGPELRVYALAPPPAPPLPLPRSRPPLLRVRALPVAVHGLAPSAAPDPRLVLRGGRYVAVTAPLAELAAASAAAPAACTEQVVAVRAFPAWVLATSEARGGGGGGGRGGGAATLLVALATGDVHVVDARTLTPRAVVGCHRQELFWSLALRVPQVGRAGAVAVAAGTSFGEIVLWRLPLVGGGVETAAEGVGECGGGRTVECDARLAGHDGPVMSIAYSADEAGAWMASASVDRSVRLWRRGGRGGGGDGDGAGQKLAYVPYCALYGHSARVWQLALCPSCPGTADSVPPRVLSVSEDRTLRLWIPTHANADIQGEEGSNRTEQVFSCHAGNVWTVAVTESPGGGKVCTATGGDDGVIHMREIGIESVSEVTRIVEEETCRLGVGTKAEVSSQIKSVARPSDGIDTLFERRKRAGVADEAVQSIHLSSSMRAVVTTSYGRILAGHLPEAKDSIPQWSTLLDDDLGLDTLVEDAGTVERRATVFAPNSLVVVRDLVFAGTTEGVVVAGKLNAAGTALSLVSRLPAFSEDMQPRLVAGLFSGAIADEGASSTCSRCSHVNLYVASLSGALHHWLINTTCLEAELSTVYAPGRTVKQGQVTAVLGLPAPLRGVLVGDRRGYLHLYSGRHQSPLAHCRPHKDRLSSLVCSSAVAQRSASDDRSSESGTVAVLSTGFDGRLTEVLVRGPVSDGSTDADPSLTVASSLRCKDHLESLIQVSCLQQSPEPTASLQASRPVVVGFRGASLLAHDVVSQTHLFRANVGGWRRALATHTECPRASANDGCHDAKDISSMTVTFWRSGVLRLAHYKPPLTAALGVPFHGLRTHAAALVATDSELGFVDVLTASEDTSLRVTALSDRRHPGDAADWRSKQVLSAHQSGVTSVSTLVVDRTSGSAIAASGGGMDEVVVWTRPRYRSAWTLSFVHSPIAASDAREPRHRVMCVALTQLQPGDRIALLAGRSDGSVALAELVQCGRDGAWQWVDAVRITDAHAGAVLCCAWQATPCGGSSGSMHCVSGDSGGRTCLWRLSTAPRGDCDKRRQPALALVCLCSEDGVHTAGVNDVACAAASDGSGALTVASAGDDEAVMLRGASVGGVGGAVTFGRARVAARFGAAACGVVLLGGGRGFAAVGADQALLYGGLGGGLRRAATAVADPAGLVVVREDADIGAQVAVFGVGMEVATLELR